jgi:uncharacterized membrane protein HdeD (DUF308 family)
LKDLRKREVEKTSLLKTNTQPKEDRMSVQNLTEEVKKRSAWSIFMGIVTAALGCFLIVYPLATAAITTVLLGWALIFVGLAQFVFAVYSQTIGNFFLKVLLSLLYGICGIALAFFPIAGVAALTGVLGTLLLIQAGLLAATAFQLRPVEGWGWFLFDAATNLLLGILILAKWPSSSIWAIGTLVGVSVVMSGISRIMIATKIRSGAANVERFVRAA